MEEEKIFIGSHVSMNSPEFYLGSVKEAIGYGSTTFMFYTGAPQNSFRKPVEELRIEEGRKLLLEHGFDESKLIVHAPYIINPANSVKKDLFDLSVKTIVSELRRTEKFHASILVLHPGSHVSMGSQKGIETAAKALDEVFKIDGTNVKIAIETMAGKGAEIGASFDEIKKLISLSHYPERLGVCMDTCHIHDAGYDINDFDYILKEFDEKVGLNRLLVLHVNDTKNPKGAHKDRHENIGYGYIGFEPLYKIVHHPLLREIPKILETPFYNGKAPYKQEIEMLLSGQYINDWRDKQF